MWIKICGNTSLEDARLATDLGVDAVGFVFAPSKRRVTPEQVAAITPHLPSSVERVGVFHEHSPVTIAAIVRQAGLTAVQLHGTPSQDTHASQEIRPSPKTTGEDFTLGRKLAGLLPPGVTIIQTVHWTVASTSDPASSLTQAQQLRDQLSSLSTLSFASRVLLDSKVGVALGGTGVPFDWTSARDLFASPPASLHLILAGGLSPENVSQAIGLLHPWGIDAVSGIEAAPGRKDAKKLAAFVKNARA